MTAEANLQSSFALGEIDPALFNRVDEQSYRKACQKLTNFIITSFGTALKRDGFARYVDVSTEIGTETTFRFLIQAISSPSETTTPVLMLLIGTVAHLALATEVAPTFQSVTLTGYTAAQIQEAQFLSVQSNIIILHPAVVPKRIEYSGTTFSLATYPFAREPTFDLGTIDYSSDDVYIEAPATGSNITTIHIKNITFTNDWVGGVIIGPGPDDTSPFGSGRINAVTVNATETAFQVLANHPFLTATGYATSSAKGADISIQQPVFTSALGYPSTGAYYQNRVWFTGHPRLPLTVFGSKLGTANNFDVGTALPTDAIIYSMEEDNVGDIIALNVGKQLQVFTRKAEFSVPEDDGGLSPQTFSIKRQTDYGISEKAQPVNFQNYTFFAGRIGSTILKYEETGGLEASYTTTNISQLASHLIKDPTHLATFYSSDQSTLLLAVLNSDNSMSILSYDDTMGVTAWSPFTFATDTSVLSMDSANNILYILRKYEKTGKYYLERLDFSKTVPVDAAIPVSLPAQAPTADPPSIHNLEDLEGYQVGVSSGSIFLGIYTVVSGSITLDKPVTEAFTGYVGFVFIPNLRPMNALAAPGYVYGRKTIDALYVDYAQSLAITIEGSAIPYQNFAEIRAGKPLQLKDGTAEYIPQDGWNRYNSFNISQTAPVNLHILSLGYRISEDGL